MLLYIIIKCKFDTNSWICKVVLVDVHIKLGPLRDNLISNGNKQLHWPFMTEKHEFSGYGVKYMIWI